MCRKLIEIILKSFSIIYLTLCTQTVGSDKYSEQYSDVHYPDYYQYDHVQINDYYSHQKHYHSKAQVQFQLPRVYPKYYEGKFEEITELGKKDQLNNFTMMKISDLLKLPRKMTEDKSSNKIDDQVEERDVTVQRKNITTRSNIYKSNDRVGLKISAPNCGKTDAQERIVGGKDAPEGAYPWVVNIMKNGEPQCSGSILNERWILTASHCFMDEPPEDSTWVIRVGTINRNRGITYKIGKVIMHERFNIYGKFNSDIALMKTTKPIKMSKLVRPVCLPNNSYEEPHKPQLIVVGWGVLEFDTDDFPVILQEVSLNVLKKGECQKRYRRKRFDLYKSQICTYNYDQDACQGDSGGPAIEFDKGKAYLIGIVSYGGTCADEYPGVYTEVSYYLNWILKKIKPKEWVSKKPDKNNKTTKRPKQHKNSKSPKKLKK